MKHSAKQLPLLDIANYYTHRSAFVEELRHACHTVGFFLIRHDTTLDHTATQMLEESREFFQRPLDEKQEISYAKSPSFRGFMELGVENTAGTIDHREQVEYAVEYPNECSPKKSWPVYERLKEASNPWPTSFQPSLQSVTLEFATQVCRVANVIRDSLCLALNVNPTTVSNEWFNNHPTEVPHWVVKLIRYPAVSGETQQGVGAHTDTNFLTLVLQDDSGGLQAYSQGEWVDVPTVHGSNVLVCNLGEQAEVWSRGYFLATPHRVLRNTHQQNHRISVPLFYNPVLSATIRPLDESIIKGAVWERHHDTKHWRRNNNAMLASVGENTFKSLARSHPKVFETHHSDLTILPDGQIVRKKEY
mmetsp:Transcript_25104/g.38108  ORF Transcript_25104/g.38108 Transcript_25104/m.38108 type:complete len:361 (+) Transcript_25104:112-1194(+)|eukprot:CAMPEP_0178900080 /NCGR_PEP_ID=MMETSP0786-20121207/3271_1 /TAXON_ID=186022 /ORGANISM="Thalassionema frauenfeldii, Strain CCMP 1798" /LENGTH=360 /DNA_ID=CAMNT_0020571037 /DNA_START=53 /DNA_END=1135 /DNA_ORIENTATION=-